MKNKPIFLVIILLILFFIFKPSSQENRTVVNVYPWQVEILEGGRSRVFGIVLHETTLKEVDGLLNFAPTIALYESKEKLTLEAYYKNVSLAGLIGSFIFTLDASVEQMNEIKRESHQRERTKNDEVKYKLDKVASTKAKVLRVKNLIYIPTVQLDEETIVKRFGEPAEKIKLKTKEMGWHYLYPEKGLDLIYKEKGKEVLQYVMPKKFNTLLTPLQSH